MYPNIIAISFASSSLYKYSYIIIYLLYSNLPFVGTLWYVLFHYVDQLMYVLIYAKGCLFSYKLVNMCRMMLCSLCILMCYVIIYHCTVLYLIVLYYISAYCMFFLVLNIFVLVLNSVYIFVMVVYISIFSTEYHRIVLYYAVLYYSVSLLLICAEYYSFSLLQH